MRHQRCSIEGRTPVESRRRHPHSATWRWARAALAVIASASVMLLTRLPAAAETPPLISEARPLVITTEQAQASVQALASWAVAGLPRVHEGERDWGETKKVWSGVKLRFDGLELKTHRRFREVRHGRWVRYQLRLPPVGSVPAVGQEGLEIRIEAVQQLADGRWQIQSSVTAPIDFDARVERWNLGVQWYSVNVKGDLRVRLRTTATIGFYADYTEIPPALVIDPRIEAAELVLERFEVDRISKVGGDVAEELGDLLRDVIRERAIDQGSARLTSKLNAQIDRKRDRLRWSLTDWIANFDVSSPDGSSEPEAN